MRKLLILNGLVALWLVFLTGCEGAFCLGCDSMVITYSPQVLDFGGVYLDTSKTLTLQLQNGSSEGLIFVTDITLDGISEDEFTIVVEGAAGDSWASDHQINLAAGEIADITVIYTPSGTGADIGSIAFAHNVATQNYRTRVPVSASGQVNGLVCNPDPIDFGDAEVGTTSTMDVTITNTGNIPIDVQDIYLDYEGSYDFSFVEITSGGGAPAKTALDPGDSLDVVLQYAPADGGPDTSNLIISGTMDGAEEQWAFRITGNGISPNINVHPGQINFGPVPLDTASTMSFVLRNDGNADLILNGIGLLPGSDESLKIDGGPTPEQPVILAPLVFQEFHVTWTPTTVPADQEAAIGTITIFSNDTLASPSLLPVHGIVDAPSIDVMPMAVDFGLVAEMVAQMATITISNNGYGPLIISSLTITDESNTEYGHEFAIVYDATFPVTSQTNPVESTIEGNSFQAVKLTYTNKGPHTGWDSAKLVIASNSKGLERIEIPLNGTPHHMPECRAQFVPSTLNFSTVAIGFPETMEMRLVNTGTGSCTLKQYKIADCSTDLDGITTCPAQLTGTSAWFTITNSPSNAIDALAAGATMPIQVQFTPPTDPEQSNPDGKYSALLSVIIHDHWRSVDFLIPVCEPPGCQPNVSAQAVVSNQAARPDRNN